VEVVLRFSHRILALPLLTAVAFAAVFAIAFVNLRDSTSLLQRLQADFFTAVNLSHGLQLEALRIRHGLDTAVSLSDPDLALETDRMADRFRELIAAGEGLGTVEPGQFARLETSFERYHALARQVTLELIAQENIATADPLLIAEAAQMNEAYDELHSHLDRLTSTQVLSMRQAMSDTRDRLAGRIRQMTVLAVGVVVVLVLMAAGAIVSIVRPLRNLRTAAGEIARGNLDAQVDYQSDDDLGQLADGFRNMQHALEADIARREEVEHALRESEERLALALDAANDGIWDIRLPEGTFYSSDRFAAILGYAPDEKPTTMAEVDAMMQDIDDAELARLFNEDRSDGREVSFETHMRRKDGGWTWVEVKGRTVAWQPDGSPRRMVGTISDISARKQAEQELRLAQDRILQAEKQASLGRLVAGLAHELNSPLGALLSGNDLAARSAGILRERLAERDCGADLEGDPRLRRALRALERSTEGTSVAAERLEELLGGLERFTALDRADLQEADLNELLDTTVAVMREIRREGMTIERRYGELPRVLCYPGELNQLFLALIRNAIEAMDHEGTLTLVTEQADGGHVRVRVRDTGRGIAPERLANLFEPGFSVDGQRMHLGWGLVTARRIAEDHGGTIAATSEPGQGSEFTIELPLRPPPRTMSAWPRRA
jgi:PAS domain S-box-containing protein